MPTISVLISTYNRKELVKNAINSVLMQDFKDFQLIIIDDCSTDGTEEYLIENTPRDSRILYIYNTVNQAAEHGDRVHIKRFVNELATGKYWIYLDSDDYWLIPDLLSRQLALFKTYPDAFAVTGGQQAHFIPDDNIAFTPSVFPRYLSSDDFLKQFSEHPIESNIIMGARLYDRETFVKSGALSGDGGRWEAGFEVGMAPGCYGGHVYIDEPCIRTEIRPTNASFRETQLTHYLDSVDGVKLAFRKPLVDFPDRGLVAVQRRTIENISNAYLGNAAHIAAHGNLGYCSVENMSRVVMQQDVDSVMADL